MIKHVKIIHLIINYNFPVYLMLAGLAVYCAVTIYKYDLNCHSNPVRLAHTSTVANTFAIGLELVMINMSIY